MYKCCIVKIIICLLLFSYEVSSADQEGKKIFNNYCAICHLKSAPSIFNTSIEQNTFINIVLNGRKGTMMGAFKNKLSTEDIKNLYKYLIAYQE